MFYGVISLKYSKHYFSVAKISLSVSSVPETEATSVPVEENNDKEED